VDWCIDDDVDSLAILPDLRSSCTQITKGPELRAGRAHSALRRSFPGGTADKILCSINRVNISFPCSNEDNSGDLLDSILVCSLIHICKQSFTVQYSKV